MNLILSPMAIWVALIVVFVVVEAATLGLTSIWFAFGALFALIVSFFSTSLLIQVTAFILSSVILLYFTKPIAKKYLKVGRERTNVDSLIGMRGVVTKPIGKHETGQVKVNGQIWTAYGDQPVEVGKEVVVEEVHGVKIKIKED